MCLYLSVFFLFFFSIFLCVSGFMCSVLICLHIQGDASEVKDGTAVPQEDGGAEADGKYFELRGSRR